MACGYVGGEGGPFRPPSPPSSPRVKAKACIIPSSMVELHSNKHVAGLWFGMKVDFCCYKLQGHAS